MNGWKERKLEDIAELINGFAFKSTDFSDHGIPVIKIKNVASGKCTLDDLQYYPYGIDKKLRQFVLKEKDILIAMTGSHVHQPSSMVGKVTRYDMPFTALLNQRVGKIVSRDQNILDEDFVYYYLNQEEVTINLAVNAGGSANQANISSEQIRSLSIYIPPLLEQRAIASVLSSLDDKIDLLHRQNKTLEGIAEALWRKMFVEEIKAKWPIKKLEELCTITRGASPRPIIEYVKDGTVPWIKIADGTASGSYFINKTNEFIIESGVSKSVKVFPGDLILSNSATCGLPFFVDLEGCIHDGWLLFRDFRGISKLFMFFFLKQLNEELNHIADGSVQNNLNTGLLKEYLLNVPPLNLIYDFESFAETAVTRIKKNVFQIRTLTQLRDTLLPKLMSGKVRVRQ